jgi:phage terminase large subunit GpA-like protein
MLLLANDDRQIELALAEALRPPPPVDLNQWAADYLEFGTESPYPGRYSPERLPFFKRVLEVLGPDHPAREVTLLKSAQLGGTLLAQIFIAASMDLDPGGILYCQATEANANRLAKTKWRLQIRSTPRLQEIFETRQSKEGGNSTLYQERKDGRGWLQFTGANSAAALSMVSVKRLVKDDLSKWENNEAGDPEYQADSRARAFREAKIFAIGTGLLETNCRTTRSFLGGTQEHYHVPCPHCGHRHPFDPHNFVANIDPDHPERACFTCPACGGVIEERHRSAIVAAGEWVAHNPGAERVSFYVWAAYAGLESWARIAHSWLAAKGDPTAEQVWWNDAAGQAYSLPGDSPPWGELKERAEAAGRPRGVIPSGALLLTLSLDVQDLYLEGVVVGWGRDLKRWVIERVIVEGHISTPETRAELTDLVARQWPMENGGARQVDITGIDGNAWTDAVYDWARNFAPRHVVMLRGVGGDAAPALAKVRKERNREGKLVKYGTRFYNVGVNALKGGLYKFLRIANPSERGYIDFPAGLEDDYYEQLTAEKRVAVVDRRGFPQYQWTKAPNARNEQLDVMNYGEALAGMKGWRTLSPAAWDALEKRLSGAPPPAPVVRGPAPPIEMMPDPGLAPASSPAPPPSGMARYRFA